jgi:hypothetical protein
MWPIFITAFLVSLEVKNSLWKYGAFGIFVCNYKDKFKPFLEILVILVTCNAVSLEKNLKQD